jgi:RNA polymerase sigma factor for flagellar operon FliA
VAPPDSDDTSPVAPRAPADAPEVAARIRDALDLVRAIARRTRTTLHVAMTVEELESYGHEGLLRAARTFDDSLGVPFRCWATLRIRGAMIDGVRSSGTLPRRVYRRMKQIEAADEMQGALVEEDAGRPAVDAADADARLSRYVASMATAMALSARDGGQRESENVADDAPTPEEVVARAELAEKMKLAVEQIPEQEQHVIRRYYFEEAGLDEIGKELGLSKSWTSRIHTRAVAAITRELARQRAGP